MKKKTRGKQYFTQDTENAIIRFNDSENQDEREQIFRDEILYPIDKLAENIINRFKFPYIDATFHDIKDQVVGFLVLNMHKFKAGKGKAFSYFSVIAKNYLILNNNAMYRHERRIHYFSEPLAGQLPLEEIMVVDTAKVERAEEMEEFSELMLEFWDHNLTRIFKKQKDIEIANAILELLRRSHMIENYNKKALYLMIREMTGYKTSNITKVVNKMAIHVRSHQNEFRNNGTLTDTSPHFTYR